MKCWQKWQDAQVTLQKKREAEAKLQLANKPDKLQQAKDEIKEVILSNIILEVRLSALTHSFCINALLYTIFIYKSLTHLLFSIFTEIVKRNLFKILNVRNCYS